MSDLLTETIASFLRRNDLSPSDETLKHLAFALDSALEDEGFESDDGENYPDDAEHAHHVYCMAYEGRHRGLAETREVSLPEWATGGLSVETLFRLARMERERDDLALAAMQRMARQAREAASK
jgi:transcriptional regulator with XRE-family HTH domain